MAVDCVDDADRTGDETLPRRSTEDYTWLSVRVPRRLHDDIARAARKDDRPLTAQARRLLEEALRARGQLTESPDDDEAAE